MSESDWMILRLVRKMVKDGAPKVAQSRDVVGAIVYLNRTYGTDEVFKCITAIEAEEIT